MPLQTLIVILMSLNWMVSLFGSFWGGNLQKGESANYIGNYFKALTLLLPVSIPMVTGAGTAAFSQAALRALGYVSSGWGWKGTIQIVHTDFPRFHRFLCHRPNLKYQNKPSQNLVSFFMSYVIFFKALILPLGELAGLLEAGLQPESSGEILSDSATIFFPAASWAENNSFDTSWLLGLVY